MKETDTYPMHRAPRCCANSKRSGLPCQNPAVRGKTVCRMHGAGGGAKPGKAHPNYRHGGRSRDTVLFRGLATALAREGRDAMDALGDD